MANKQLKSELGAGMKGIPTTCRCGESVLLMTSCTAKNPGRLFYACPYGTEGDKWNHLFKWTDRSVVEEVEGLIEKVENLEVDGENMEKSISVCQSEIENLANKALMNEIATMKKIEECKMEIRSLKNILGVVCVLVVVLKFFF